MIHEQKTLTQFLIEQRLTQPKNTTGDLHSLVQAVASACKVVAKRIAMGNLRPDSDATAMDDEALEIIAAAVTRTGLTCGLLPDRGCGPISPSFVPREHPEASERARIGEPIGLDERSQERYVLVCDQLDGARSIDLNGTAGSIFSILRVRSSLRSSTPVNRVSDNEAACTADFLQAGSQQVAGGYAIYGPATMLVLTLGHGTHGFTLDPLTGEWLQTHPEMQIPAETADFHINSSYARFWEPPVKRYVDECLSGTAGDRGKDFNMRWVASLVADCHRILLRGGVFLSPRLVRDNLRHGKLLLLQQVNPIAFLVEQAGGRSTSGTGSPLETVPTEPRQQSPFIFGSAKEVARIEEYHTHEDEYRAYTSPLFGARGLFAEMNE